MVSAKEVLRVLCKKLTNGQLEATSRIPRLMNQGGSFPRKMLLPLWRDEKVAATGSKEKKLYLATVLAVWEWQRVLFLLPTRSGDYGLLFCLMACKHRRPMVSWEKMLREQRESYFHPSMAGSLGICALFVFSVWSSSPYRWSSYRWSHLFVWVVKWVFFAQLWYAILFEPYTSYPWQRIIIARGHT